MGDVYAFGQRAKQFAIELFQRYMVERDFPGVKAMLHSQISWFGTGRHEVCHNYADAVRLLDAERSSWDGHFKILDHWLEAVPLDEESCIVYGELRIKEDGLSTILMDMESRLSLVCKLENGQPKLYHLHFSVPNLAQGEGEFVHKQLVLNYNVLLEETLLERTRLLKEKTQELEAIVGSIIGGVQICKFEPGFPILYASEGFYSLCGYTPQELADRLDGLHSGLVFEDDRVDLVRRVQQQLLESPSFSLEYRIRHRDGHLIWVLDKGSLLPGADGQSQIQCILTDISTQKAQEEELRMSQKRYVTALRLTDATIFEYDILKNQMILFDEEADRYNVPNVVENGMETFIQSGIVEPACAADYRAMYEKIFAGEPFAQCFINTRDKDGLIHDYQLSLATIYDDDGRPVRAVGVRKNATQLLQLQKEQAYGETLASGKRFGCEADLSIDQVVQLSDWLAQDLGLEGEPTPPFSQLVSLLADSKVATQHQELFYTQLSAHYISQQFQQGISLYSFAYLRLVAPESYRWYECTINIIRDQLTGKLNLRLYQANVHNRKLREHQLLEERQLYESLVAKSNLAYEINLTRDQLVRGHAHWEQQFGIHPSSHYSQMVLAFASQAAYPEDGPIFATTFSRDHLLECYASRQRQASCEFRRISSEGEYRWVRCSLHMYADPVTQDIKGFAYVEDIDEDKRNELALLYDAQHDRMTGLLNKATTEQEMAAFLKSPEAASQRHALLVVDIDYFKSINDQFGHLFGDVVLSEIAGKLRTVFRERDLIGRIGGDEFCILLKNVQNSGIVRAKAQEVCHQIARTYAQAGKSVTVSASVGIALFAQHGLTYKELFAQADDALYTAKKQGRNRYFLP